MDGLIKPGSVVRLFRLRLGWSLEDLATASKVPLNVLQGIENDCLTFVLVDHWRALALLGLDMNLVFASRSKTQDLNMLIQESSVLYEIENLILQRRQANENLRKRLAQLLVEESSEKDAKTLGLIRKALQPSTTKPTSNEKK